MYGYQLEFGRFPYLAAGPTTITPLILAVLCLLGSERLAHLSYYRGALYGAVKTLLLESPAESWQRLGTAVNKNPDGINGEDELDPELGIGPEEIVGAAMLSMWIGGRNDAMWIADVAFKWARGWIRVSACLIVLIPAAVWSTSQFDRRNCRYRPRRAYRFSSRHGSCVSLVLSR